MARRRKGVIVERGMTENNKDITTQITAFSFFSNRSWWLSQLGKKGYFPYCFPFRWTKLLRHVLTKIIKQGKEKNGEEPTEEGKKKKRRRRKKKGPRKGHQQLMTTKVELSPMLAVSLAPSYAS